MSIIQSIKTEMEYQLDNFPLENIDKLIDEINNSTNIYFTGVGKSGTLALHTSNILKSLGIKSFYLKPVDSLHGDIGSIKQKDLVIMFSKSGNTVELLNISNVLKSKNINVIGVCCNTSSKFSQICDSTIVLPINNELSSNIKTLPTNSCMVQLLFCNILSSKIAENIDIINYKLNHPSGAIGLKLLTIEDKITNNFPKFVIKDKILLRDLLLEMTRYKLGCCFFVDCKDNLIGILTDGDIRRMLIKDSAKSYITINELNKHFVYEENLNKFISEIRDVKIIPILNNRKLIGIVAL